MIDLQYGYKKPEDGDRGDSLFSALEGNIDKISVHNHDGVNSSKINLSSTEKLTMNISSSDWVADTDGLFKVTKNFPSAYTYDDCVLDIRDSSGNKLYLDYRKSAVSQFTLYANEELNLFIVFV